MSNRLLPAEQGSRKVPNEVHEGRGWAISDIAHDFTLLDVWALPVRGEAADFELFLEMISSFDPRRTDSRAARLLWLVRDRLGRWLRLDPVSSDEAGGFPIPGTREMSVAERLPHHLRSTAKRVYFDVLPVVPLYRTAVEAAVEIANQTVHGVLHFGWVDQRDELYQGEMAIYVKPRGRLGAAYLALIQPFRHWVVYPALMREIERAWATRIS